MHILDLAKRMIDLSGHRWSGEIDVVFTGVRPGEGESAGGRAAGGSLGPADGAAGNSG